MDEDLPRNYIRHDLRAKLFDGLCPFIAESWTEVEVQGKKVQRCSILVTNDKRMKEQARRQVEELYSIETHLRCLAMRSIECFENPDSVLADPKKSPADDDFILAVAELDRKYLESPKHHTLVNQLATNAMYYVKGGRD